MSVEEYIECLDCNIDLKFEDLIDGNYCPRCHSGWHLFSYLGQVFEE